MILNNNPNAKTVNTILTSRKYFFFLDMRLNGGNDFIIFSISIIIRTIIHENVYKFESIRMNNH